MMGLVRSILLLGFLCCVCSASAQDTALIARAWTLTESGDLEGALEASAAAIGEFPDSAVGYFLHGLALAGLGRDQEALRDYDQAIRLEPYVPETYLERARSHYALANIDAALRDIRHSLREDPAYWEALLLRAEIHLDQNELPAALEDLELAKRYAPKEPEVYCLRAEAYWTLGDPKQALKEANYAVRLAPADPMPYATRANAHLAAGAPTAALADADRAIELAPESYALLNTRAFVKLQLDDLEGAHNDLDRYLEKDSLAYEAHLTRALLYESKGDLVLATAAVEKARTMQPNDPAIVEQLGFLWLRQGHDSAVVRLLEPIVDAHPTHAFALSTLGLAHARTGNPALGLKELDRALKLDPYDPRAYYHRALVHFQLEKPEKGCVDLTEAEQMGFGDLYNPEELTQARAVNCDK